MEDLETWLERVYQADGEAKKLDQSLLFRSYLFSEKEAHLRHWVLAYRKH